MGKQGFFYVCDDCGKLRTGQGETVIRGGKPAIVCGDCRNNPEPKADTPDALAEYFEKKYNLSR